MINVILIDPTDKGEAVARAIAIRGSVYAVTSPEELAQYVGSAAQQQQELARQADAIIGKYQREAESLTAKERPTERLSFTAGYPLPADIFL